MTPTFTRKTSETYTDRYVVTFREDEDGTGLQMLRDLAGVKDIVHARDFADRAVTHSSMKSAYDGAMFDDLNMCVVNCATTAAERIASHARGSAILAIEPDHEVFAIGLESEVAAAADEFLDTGNETWGIHATQVQNSQFTGNGVDVAVLDTGIDGSHTDFQISNMVSRQGFVSGSDTADGNGHGTHCAGIIAGTNDPRISPQYGVAPGASLHIGKVLDDEGNGSVRSSLAGLNWAVANHCHVVSMSVGAEMQTAAVMFDEAGRRALKAGTLVVAAAGNNADRRENDLGFVGRPANSRHIMAVGAVDRMLQLANFSARSSVLTGGEVDIVAPGVEVYSTWLEPERYKSISGTSMATPFVAGIAALYAEAFGIRGFELWKRLIEEARSLAAPTVDAGAGLVQAV